MMAGGCLARREGDVRDDGGVSDVGLCLTSAILPTSLSPLTSLTTPQRR